MAATRFRKFLTQLQGIKIKATVYLWSFAACETPGSPLSV